MKICFASLVISASAMVIGCGPSSLYECKMAAAKMPTGQGAAMATAACAQKFEPPVQKVEFVPVVPAPTAPPLTDAQINSLNMSPRAAQLVMERYPYLDTISNGVEVQEYILREALKKVSTGMQPDAALQQAADTIAPHYRPR